MQNHCKFRDQLQKTQKNYLTCLTLKLHENGCKFSQTWLIRILARYGSFENRYWIFRGNKMPDVIEKYFCYVILEKTRRAFCPDGRFPHVTLNSILYIADPLVRPPCNNHADLGLTTFQSQVPGCRKRHRKRKRAIPETKTNKHRNWNLPQKTQKHHRKLRPNLK